MYPEESVKHVLANGANDFMKEPSTMTVKQYYDKRIKDSLKVFEEQSVINLAKSTLLIVSDVEMRLQHLSGVSCRRKIGAGKAAAARKVKPKSNECGTGMTFSR